MPGDDTFACPSCARRFRWRPQLAGRRVKCRCGATMGVPEADPAELLNDDDTFELDTADRRIDTVVKPSKCVSCNSPLSPGAVLCINCGADQRSGQKLGKPTVEALPPGQRVTESSPKRVVTGMRLVLAGLWLNLAGVAVILLGMLAQFMLLFYDAGVAELAGLVRGLLSGVLLLVGPLLCLGVPAEVRGRTWLTLSISSYLTNIALGIGSAAGLVDDAVLLVSPVLSIFGVLTFLLFLRKLADNFDFPQIVDDANRMIGLFIGLVCASLVLPFALFALIYGLVIVALYLAYALYVLIKYLGLLIDLIRATSHRLAVEHD